LLGAAAVLALDLVLLAIGVGGPRALLHHARALALFATWLIAAPLLAILRPAGRVCGPDPIAARPDPPVMTALVLIPLLTPMLSALAERAGLWPLPGGAALRWGGVALAAAGYALRIAAMVQLGSRFAPVAAVQREHALETGGPYSMVRHPGYLGAWLCELGIVLAFGSAAALALPALMALAIAARVSGEEGLLEERFGSEFRAWRARVGGFVPRIGRGS
jgi:protein-S-isoprenylcysteine O-methyltransferase Ste14